MSTDKEVKRDTGQQPAVEEFEKIVDSEEVKGYTKSEKNFMLVELVLFPRI